MEKEEVSKKSLDFNQLQLQKIKKLFPEVVTEGKVDFNKLKATLGEDTLADRDSYKLTWAGKEDIFKVIQKQSSARLSSCREESIDFDGSSNIFIEGENLEVLKLLQKSYMGKVKMIYIDPPYNTGNDFIYKDDYTDGIKNYLKQTGQVDEDGNHLTTNTETDGRYHSNWLNMMYPRLFLARQLLKEDGIIFISVDDNEIHNLKIIMNEIFGEEKFLAQFVWKSRQNKDNRNKTRVSIDHEYILCYGKKLRGDDRNEEQYSNPDNDPRGPWTSANMVGLLPEDKRPNCHYDLINPETGINYGKPEMGWRYDKSTMQKLIEEDRILWPDSPDGRPRKKSFLNELEYNYTGYSSIIGEDIYTRNGTKELEEIFGVQRLIDYPKPIDLLKELIVQGCDEKEGIVLDFFAGSCSLAQAVLEQNQIDNMNRKFIVVQLPEPTPEGSNAREEGYKNIAELGKDRIKKVINGYGDQSEPINTGFKVFKLTSSVFKQWESFEDENVEKLKEQMELFDNMIDEDASEEDVIYEVLLKQGFDLNSDIINTDIDSNNVYKIINKSETQDVFYICLDDKINDNTLEELGLTEDDVFICLDSAMTDEQKVNISMQARLEVI